VLVLLTEAEPGDAAAAAHILGSAGHTLSYCHPPWDPDRACGAVADGGRCALVDDDIDVVVDVRQRAIPITEREHGATCAVQRGCPLVVCGPVTGSPMVWARADVQCDSVPDLPAACASATQMTSPSARRAVIGAVRRVLHTLDRPPPKAVHLQPGQVVSDVVITLRSALPEREQRLLQSAVQHALMGYTPLWEHVAVVAHHGKPAVGRRAAAGQAADAAADGASRSGRSASQGRSAP